MANNLLTISMITNETLMVLENELTFADHVDRQYDAQFCVPGAKIGYTVNARKPARYIGTTGPALNVEDTNETFVPVTLTTQFHVDVQFNTADMATSIDLFKKRIIKPAVATVANKIDRDGLVNAYQSVGGAVGTPGVAPSGALTFLQAGALLDSEAAPRDGERVLILDQWTQAVIADGLKGNFNPQAKIGEIVEKGMLGKATLGFDWYMDQNVVSYQVGAQGGSPVYTTTGTSSALLTSGWADNGTLQTSGWSNTTAVLNVGDVITLAGVYGVNPQNRGAYASNRLKQFVVVPFVGTPSAGTFNPTTNVYTSSGTGTLQLQIAECVISAGQFQNVTAQPLNNGVITVLGTSNTVSPQSIAMHKDAFALVMADLELPGGVDMAARAADKEVGMSIRVVRQYTINNDALPTRFDVLYGYKTLYRTFAVRVAG